MSPNYNLKLANLDPDATVDLRHFHSQAHAPEKIVLNHICPSQNVIKLFEARQSIELPGSLLALSHKRRRQKGVRNTARRPQAKGLSRDKALRKKRLGVDTRCAPRTDLGDKPLTPSFFKKKKLNASEPEAFILSKDTSHLSGSQQHSRVGLDLRRVACEELADVQSSVSIPLIKSSVLFKEPRTEEFTSSTLGESPLLRKHVVDKQKGLYSSLAFSISSSLDTSSKFLKLFPKDKAPAPESEPKASAPKKPGEQVASKIRAKKDQVKRLKSQRKDQIQWLRAKKGLRGIKKDYHKVKQKSRKYSGQAKRKLLMAKAGSVKGMPQFTFSVRASKAEALRLSPKQASPREAQMELEQRMVSSMRKTTETHQAKPDFIDRQLLSVQTSKVHTNFLENLFPEAPQEPAQPTPKKAPALLNVFKQRMSSNVDLNSKALFLQQRRAQCPVQRREPSKPAGAGRGKKGPSRQDPKISLRKNTSLDLVLKKKSIKFEDMRREILKSIRKEVKNIYRLSSPSMKTLGGVAQYGSTVQPSRKHSAQVSGRKKSSQKAVRKKAWAQESRGERRVTGSLDLVEAEAHASAQKVFENKFKDFKSELTRQPKANEAGPAA